MKMAEFTLDLNGNTIPFLGTHFSLITIFLSPLYYIFGSYTLLYIQIIAILYGGIGSYQYAKFYLGDENKSLIFIIIHFFSLWGIYSALSFDFHNNVIGAMLVPWLVLNIEKRNVFKSTIYFTLILFTKEVMSIWISFVLVGLMLKNLKTLKFHYIKLEIPLLLISILYGTLVITHFMPELQGFENNLQLSRYSHLGNSIQDIFFSLLNSPGKLFSLIFENTLGDPAFDYIKIETHLMLLISGGVIFFIKPHYLIMLAPLYAFKFLTNDYGFWGINYQYSIEFVPLLSIALIEFSKSIKRKRNLILAMISAITIFASLKTIDNRNSKWYNSTNTRFYSKKHYSTELNIREINSALKLIDTNDIVSASSSIVPHIAFRKKIYHFPVVKDANCIVLLLKNSSTFPLNKVDFDLELNKHQKSKEFNTIYQNDDLIIMKKRSSEIYQKENKL